MEHVLLKCGKWSIFISKENKLKLYIYIVYTTGDKKERDELATSHSDKYFL